MFHMTTETAIDATREHLEEGRSLFDRRPPSSVAERKAWANATANCLKGNLDSNSRILASFLKASEKHGDCSDIEDGPQVGDGMRGDFDTARNSALEKREHIQRASDEILARQLDLIQNAIKHLEKKLPKLNTVDAAPSIEDEMRKIAARVPDEEWDKLPPDLIDRLDYYLYGAEE